MRDAFTLAVFDPWRFAMHVTNTSLNRRFLLKLAAAGVTVTGISLPQGGFAAQDGATITLWLDISGSPDRAQWLIDNTFKEFNDLGGIQVEASMKDDGWTDTLTALDGGEGPDIVITPGPSLSLDLGIAGQLAPLDDYAAQYGWDESFFPWAIDLGTVDGTLMALPNEVETLVLYFNKTVFDDNGWTPPTTIDELTAVARLAADAGLIPFAHANAEWQGTNEWFVGEFLNHAAGPDKVHQALTGALPWTDQVFVDALTVLNEYQQNGWFMGGLDQYYAATFEESIAAFASGDAAMRIDGSWLVSDALTYFAESGQEWDWTPMPSTSGDVIFDLGIGTTYGINAASSQADAAAEFLAYFFSPEAQASQVAGAGLDPAPVNIPADLLGDIDARRERMIEQIDKVTSEGGYGYTTWTFLPPQSDTYLIEEIEKVWAGDITVEAYLQGLQDIFATELEAGDVPPLPARS
jgi:raffinose/stachyose/melibiose transport system substrate-binding protein